MIRRHKQWNRSTSSRRSNWFKDTHNSSNNCSRGKRHRLRTPQRRLSPSRRGSFPRTTRQQREHASLGACSRCISSALQFELSSRSDPVKTNALRNKGKNGGSLERDWGGGGAWRCLAPLVVAGHPSRVYRGSGGQRRLTTLHDIHRGLCTFKQRIVLRLFPWNLGAFLARLGESNCNRLFAAGHF